MQIIYVLPKEDFFAKGRRGRVAHALGVVEGLLAAGVELTVVSGPGTGEALAEYDGAQIVEICCDAPRPLRRRAWNAMLSDKVTALAGAMSGPGAIVCRYAVSQGLVLHRMLQRISGCVRCLEINSLAYHQYASLPISVGALVRSVEVHLLRNADVLYVVSDALAEDIRAADTSVPIAVVPNGARPTHNLSVDWSLAGQRPVRFTYLGIMQQYYDFDVVLEGFRVLRDSGAAAELHFYGDGYYYDRLCAADVAADGVFLHGRYRLPELLASGRIDANTVLLLPSRASRLGGIGSPIKLYEYMSFGLPIVASKVAQTVAVLENNETALFYDADSPTSLTAAMRRVLEDVHLRRRLGDAARVNFLKHHTWEKRMRVLVAELDAHQAAVSRA